MTTDRNTQLRKQLFSNREQGEHARDVQRALDSQSYSFDKKLEAFYTEPMILACGNEEPADIELVRIINLNAQETPVLCGRAVHFVWKPQLGGASITSIDGLSPSQTVKYRMTFRITRAARAPEVV